MAVQLDRAKWRGLQVDGQWRLRAMKLTLSMALLLGLGACSGGGDGIGNLLTQGTCGDDPALCAQGRLAIDFEGDGAGSVSSVSSEQSAFVCVASCEVPLAATRMVTLQAEAREGSEFIGWSNVACAADQTRCAFQAQPGLRVSALFRLKSMAPLAKVSIAIRSVNGGEGRITTSPPIPCGEQGCSGTVPVGTQLVTQVTPGQGSTLREFSSATCVDGRCTLQVDQDLSARALFQSDRICTLDNWCWEHAAPQGTDVRDVWAAAANDVWAVADQGVLHYDGAHWQRVRIPAHLNETLSQALEEGSFHHIFGLPSGDVYFLGSAGTLLHFDGKRWSQEVVAPGDSLTGLYGASAQNLWAITLGGDIWHYAGEGWIKDYTVPANLSSIWGVGVRDIWISGNGGALYRYDGGLWVSVNTGLNQTFTHLFGVSASDVWALSDQGTLAHYDGKVWQAVDLKIQTAWLGMYGTKGDDLWLVGSGDERGDKAIMHYDGKQWQSVTAPRGALESLRLNAISGSSDQDIWAVGAMGVMFHYEHGVWSALDDLPRHSLNDIWVNSPSDVWFAGDFGTLLRKSGATWQSVTSPSASKLQAIWGVNEQSVWLADSDGHLYHFDGQRWGIELMTSPQEAITHISGTSAQNVWAVGARGVVLHYDGATWQRLNAGTSYGINRILALTPSNVWLAGEAGGLWWFDGSTLRAVASNSKSDLSGIWGSGPQDLFAAGKHGIIHFDGLSWQSALTSDSASFRPKIKDLTGVAADNAWGLGQSGQLYHFDGKQWDTSVKLPTSGSSFYYNAIKAVSASQVWAVGNSGYILRYYGP